MATIASQTGQRGRKPLSIDVPLVPFLDLLLCCVMFLLVTAVWNAPYALDAGLRVPGPAGEPADAPELAALVSIEHAGYALSTTAGERVQITGRDTAALRRALVTLRQLTTGPLPVHVTSDDGIAFSELVRVIDVTKDAGYRQVDVAAGPD